MSKVSASVYASQEQSNETQENEHAPEPEDHEDIEFEEVEEK